VRQRTCRRQRVDSQNPEIIARALLNALPVAATVDALKALNGTGPAIFMASCAATLASAEFFLY